MEFLSNCGKISSILIAVTPLPTYLGVWGRGPREQIQRIDTISFSYILLCLLNNAIWCSYAYKIQNIDLGMTSGIQVLINLILAAIYMYVKPKQ